MKKIIITIGKNSQTIFLLIVLVIGLVILLNMIAFFYKKHKNPRFSQKEFLNNIFYEDQSQVYVLVRKKDYKVLFLSSHFEEVFHILPKRIQVDIEVLKEIVDDDTYRQFLKEYKQWNQQEPFKYSFKMKDENKWFILTITAIEHGKYHLFAFYDHSEDVLRELDYLQQIETTKNESEYKASFLSRMSHEIRTPMNGIIGMLTLARQSKQDAKQESYYLQQAEDISKYLLSLINEVLDMSRMEAGKLELESKPFNIYHLKAQLNNIFKETIEKKNVLFKIDYFDFDVKYFMGDELRIMQILVNLLSNASKFTDNGEITVTFRQMYKEDKVANIMMRVHDTGKGMSREFLSHIFRPFEQEGVEISKKYGGSGLGMAITDQLVKLMGGEIVVDSVRLVVDSGQILVKCSVLPEVSHKQMLQFVKDEFIDVESQYTDLLYDYAVIKDKVEGKEGQLVLCAAMEREFLKPYIDLFDEMGISLESIDIMTNSIIKLTESILKLTNLSYVLTVINGQDVIHYLFINGQYEIANRTRIFSDRGTVAFITELSNSLTKLMQFTKGAYKDAQLEKIYFAGLETYEEDMLMSTISSNLSIETSRFKPTNYTCSKDNNFPIHKYLFVGSLWRR